MAEPVPTWHRKTRRVGVALYLVLVAVVVLMVAGVINYGTGI